MFDFDKNTDRKGTFSVKWDVSGDQLPMWIADMDIETAPEITKALAARARHGIFGYTDVPDAWYDAIIGRWRRKYRFTIKKEWLQFSIGVIAAISSAVKRLTNVADKVALMTPVYDIFFHSVENAGRTVKEVPLSYVGGQYSLDLSALDEALSDPLVTLLILCNPHNPTGNLWTKKQLAAIGELCGKHGVTVISDEIHCDLTIPGKKYVPFASVSETCRQISVSCISPSKSYNTAGLQSAAVIVPNKRLRDMVVRGLNSDEVAYPNCFAIDGAIAAYDKCDLWQEELCAFLFENRKIAEKFIAENLPALKCVAGEATYLMWADCSAVADDADELCKFIAEKTGLIIAGGNKYRGNGKNFIRMNVACDRSRLADGLARLAKGVAEWQNR